MIHEISVSIDKELEDYFTAKFNLIQDEDYSPLFQMSNNILEKYSKDFKFNHKKYMRTRLETYPDIQDLLSEFLQQFLKNCYKGDIIRYFEYRYKENNFRSLSNQFQLISYYNTDIQYIISSALLEFQDNPRNTLDFLFDEVNMSLKFETIDRILANDFIKLACNPPFQASLLNFVGPDHDLRMALEQVTYSITIIQLPKGLSGFNLHCCRSIAIRWFEHKEEAKGAIFTIYLHELVHYLLKLGCQTVKECMRPKSDRKFNSVNSDEGDIFETKMFGSVLKAISIEASDYLTSGNFPESLEDFMQVFLHLNEQKPRRRFITLRTSSHMIFLGKCAFKKIHRVFEHDSDN